MAAFSNHDEYIAAAPAALQPLLMHVRVRLAQTLPHADEVIKYEMPGFASGASIIAGYAAFSKQCGLYVTKGAISACSDEIAAAGLKASKTGVTFSPTKSIPEELIAALALASQKSFRA